MTDKMNPRDVESELEAALAKYATAEPRPNLEDRILANLRAVRKRAPQPVWRRWPAAVAIAAVLVLTIALALRSKKPAKNFIVHQASATTQTQVANRNDPGPLHSREQTSQKPAAHHSITRPATTVAASPKLDQFPSPQPLSDQETILAHYVTKYPKHAALIAQARTEQLRRDSLEEIRPAPADSNEDSPQPNK
jgi:hypothetical protein